MNSRAESLAQLRRRRLAEHNLGIDGMGVAQLVEVAQKEKPRHGAGAKLGDLHRSTRTEVRTWNLALAR